MQAVKEILEKLKKFYAELKEDFEDIKNDKIYKNLLIVEYIIVYSTLLYLIKYASLSLILIFIFISVYQIIFFSLSNNIKGIISIIALFFLYVFFMMFNAIKLTFALKFMIIALLIMLFTVFMINKRITLKDLINSINSLEDVFNNFINAQNKSKKDESGDIYICTDIKTRKKVYIPYKDRFLHMLILGPTGSGKTSQIILPMLNQDIQNLNAGVTVIEPKGDLAEKVYAMAQYYGRKALYFNPILDACPTFNPLYGKEEDVIENMVTTFKMLNPDSPTFFQDMSEQLLRNALKVLKRLKGNSATLIDLDRFISNADGYAQQMLENFKTIKTEQKENVDIINYFVKDYFSDSSKTYEHCSGVRSQISKLVSNKYLRKVLNPEDGKSDIDFDKHLEEGGIISIATPQGELRELGRYLGYFIILNFQSAVFKREGNEWTRRPHFLYIDEFQEYSNPGFSAMLTQGRSYRVASHLATQNRALIGMGSGRVGQDFEELVSTNARNLVIFPGGNAEDAEYYSRLFGEKKIIKRSFGRGKSSKSLVYDNFSVNETEQTERFISADDIMYRKFGEITYRIVVNSTVNRASFGKVSYLDAELNSKLDKMIEENNALMRAGIDVSKYRNKRGELIKNLNLLLSEQTENDNII